MDLFKLRKLAGMSTEGMVDIQDKRKILKEAYEGDAVFDFIRAVANGDESELQDVINDWAFSEMLRKSGFSSEREIVDSVREIEDEDPANIPPGFEFLYSADKHGRSISIVSKKKISGFDSAIVKAAKVAEGASVLMDKEVKILSGQHSGKTGYVNKIIGPDEVEVQLDDDGDEFYVTVKLSDIKQLDESRTKSFTPRSNKMDLFKLRTLAGMSTAGIVEGAKSAPASAPDTALLSEKAPVIVATLLKTMTLSESVNFLKREAGENTELLAALNTLRSKLKAEEILHARKVAGLAESDEELEEKKDEAPEEEVSDEEANEEVPDEEAEDDLPTVLKKLCAKLMKDGPPTEEAVCDLMQKVYDAGKADAEAEVKDE